MKKSKKLCLVLSSIFLVMGLASCGTSGAKGDTGASGTNGTNGQDGKDGTNGKDGTSMLTGTSDPTSSTGNDGDVYLNSTTYDLFKKVNGVWTKIGNIKGSDGKDGQDGQDGEGGTSGVTTYGSTILPNDHGYITVNKGSAKVGESITYTFVANSGYKLSTFKLDDNTYAPASLTNGSFTTTMKADGYVVSASFVTTATKSTVITTAEELTTALETAVSGDTLTLIASDGVDLNNVVINKTGVTVNLTRNGSGTIDLNDFTISANNAVVNLDSSINNTIDGSTPIKVSGSNVVINGNGATLNGTNPITISGGSSSFNNITINTNGSGGGSSYDEGNLFNNIGKFSNPATDTNGTRFKKSAITLAEGADITLKDVTIGAGFDAAIYSYGDDATTGVNDIKIEKCTISAGKYKGIYLANAGTIDIEDSTFDGTNVKASQTTGTTLTDEQKQSGSLIDINQLNEGGVSVTIKNNKFNNMTDNGSMSGAIIVKTSGSGAFSGALDISGNTFSNNKRDIIIGQGGLSGSLAFTGTKTVQDYQTVNGTTSKIKFYDNTGAFETVTFDKYVFENGQLYGYDSANPSIKKAIIGVTFDAGDGTSSHPLEISKSSQIPALGNEKLTTANFSGQIYLKLTDNVDYSFSDACNIALNANYTIDLNEKKLCGIYTGNQINAISIALFINYGNLIINDNKATSENNTTDLGCVQIKNHDDSDQNKTINYGVCINTISNRNTLTLNNGKIENIFGKNDATSSRCNLHTYAVDNYNNSDSNVQSEFNMKGGELYCKYCCVRSFCQSTKESNKIVMSISGGKLTGGQLVVYLQDPGDCKAKGDLTISGGTFIGGKSCVYLETGATPITTGENVDNPCFNFYFTGGNLSYTKNPSSEINRGAVGLNVNDLAHWLVDLHYTNITASNYTDSGSFGDDYVYGRVVYSGNSKSVGLDAEGNVIS